MFPIQSGDEPAFNTFGKLRSLRVGLQAKCLRCTHVRTFSAEEVSRWPFGNNTQIATVARKFRCAECRSKDVRVQADFRRSVIFRRK